LSESVSARFCIRIIIDPVHECPFLLPIEYMFSFVEEGKPEDVGPPSLGAQLDHRLISGEPPNHTVRTALRELFHDNEGDAGAGAEFYHPGEKDLRPLGCETPNVA